MSHSYEKCLTDRRMDRQTDGQTDNSNFVGPSVGWGPITRSQKFQLAKQTVGIYTAKFWGVL